MNVGRASRKVQGRNKVLGSSIHSGASGATINLVEELVRMKKNKKFQIAPIDNLHSDIFVEAYRDARF